MLIFKFTLKLNQLCVVPYFCFLYFCLLYKKALFGHDTLNATLHVWGAHLSATLNHPSSPLLGSLCSPFYNLIWNRTSHRGQPSSNETADFTTLLNPTEISVVQELWTSYRLCHLKAINSSRLSSPPKPDMLISGFTRLCALSRSRSPTEEVTIPSHTTSRHHLFSHPSSLCLSGTLQAMQS